MYGKVGGILLLESHLILLESVFDMAQLDSFYHSDQSPQLLTHSDGGYLSLRGNSTLESRLNRY